ncbi:unnamed protein product, partial [Rotaria socialis]
TLTTLNLWSNQIGALGAQHLADALQHNTTLTTLDLSFNQIGDKLMDCVAKLIKQTLNETHLPDNKTERLPGLLPFVPDKSVLLTNNIACELGLSNSTQCIFRELLYDDYGDLGSLKVRSDVFPSNTIYIRKPLYALVEINTSQVEADLDGLTPKLIPIPLVISFNHLHFLSQTLTALDLSSNGIGALEAQHLADALQHNTTLTTLYLSENQIGALGAQHLANALQHNTTLTALDLSSNGIGALEAQHLADALQHNTVTLTLYSSISFNQLHFLSQTLTTLDLSSNDIGDELMDCVAKLIERNEMEK